MAHALFRRIIVGTTLAFLVASTPTATRSETFVGSTTDTRAIVAFKVAEAAAQAWLPKGWTVAPFRKGPLKGSNLLAVFVDRHLSLDAQGKPSMIPHFRGVALVTPASRAGSDETRTYVTRIYITDASLNPYKNSVDAEIGRTASYAAVGNAAASGSENWSVKAGAGETMSFRMEYIGGTPSYAEREGRPYSNVEPDFHRIYRYKQLSDLVMSVPAGVDRVEEHSFSTSIAELAPMFDGSEELIGIIRIPFYTRKTYLP